jgi:type IV pilus assembly protein PilV
MNRRTFPLSSEHGFSMVEVLVALVVLAVGMLGIASLHVVSLQSNGSAISRMQAVGLAGELADRIRANRNAGSAYAYVAGSTNPEDQGCTNDAATADPCTAAEMAESDLAAWEAQIEATLPGSPAGSVTFTDGNPDTYVITVSWFEPGSGDPDDADSRLSYTLRLQI